MDGLATLHQGVFGIPAPYTLARAETMREGTVVCISTAFIII